jgi:hypothetical protein
LRATRALLVPLGITTVLATCDRRLISTAWYDTGRVVAPA